VSDPNVIEATRLTVRYGRHCALAGLDLRVEAGERVALFGPNGAGKTTLLRVLAGLLQPTTGRVVVGGGNPANLREARRRLGFLGHATLLYEELTARENLRFYASLYHVPRADDRVEAVLDRIGLTARGDDRVGTFSRGMQQRLALGRAVLHDPPFLLLDEPETGLDITAGAVLESLLTRGEADRGVVFTSHNIDLGLRLATRMVVLVEGRIARDSPAAGVTRDEIAGLFRPKGLDR
jgi:heme exporter protein A